MNCGPAIPMLRFSSDVNAQISSETDIGAVEKIVSMLREVMG